MENEKVAVLIDAGLQEIEAKILLFLFGHNEVVSRFIERELYLRQPDVCNVMSGFLKKGWVSKKKKEKTGGRGRPEIIFTLIKKKEEMLEDIKKQLKQRSIQIEETLEKLDKSF